MNEHTLAQRILSQKVGRTVVPGEVVEVNVDIALTHEVLGPLALDRFEKLGVRLWNPNKVYVAIDHFVPPATKEQAENIKVLMTAVMRHKIIHTAFFDGPSHITLAESGIVKPGNVIVGTDSHTCTAGALGAFATGIGSTEMAGVFALGKIWFRVPQAIAVKLIGTLTPIVSAKDAILYLLSILGVDGARYCSLEFGGSGFRALPMDERFVFTNMAVERSSPNSGVNSLWQIRSLRFKLHLPGYRHYSPPSAVFPC